MKVDEIPAPSNRSALTPICNFIRMRKAISFTHMLVFLVCLGCGGDGGPQASEVGDRPNPRRVIQDLPQWVLADSAELSIGVAQGDPEQEFGSVSAGAFGPRGVYLLDGGNHEVRVFDRTGAHVMTLGGEGEGPGEFQYPTHLVVGLDSSVFVWDRSLHRLTTFGHDGSTKGMATVQQGFLNPRLSGVQPDGSFFLNDFRYPENPGTGGVGTVTLTVYSPSGDLVDTLEILEGPHMTGSGLMGRPFTTPDEVAPAREGVWVHRVDTALIVRIGPSGDTLQRIEWETPDRAVTEADLDEYEAWRVEGVEDPVERRERVAHLRDRGFAASRHPAGVNLRTDRAGRVWIVERHNWQDIGAMRWLIFDVNGRAVAHLAEPPGSLTILDADETHALVRMTDELGVHRVEVRRILHQEHGQPETSRSSPGTL